jgi:hypothetical protein
VGFKPDVHLEERPDSPPAGWNGTFFLIKILHKVQNFYQKGKTRTMLPQAKPAFGSDTRPNKRHRESPVTLLNLFNCPQCRYQFINLRLAIHLCHAEEHGILQMGLVR